MAREVYLPLWIRILLVATLNVALLGGVFAVFLRLQLKPDLESFLMAQSRERIGTVTSRIVSDLESTDMTQWSNVLKRYSAEQGITILLYRNTGEQLAGALTPLPPEVDVRLPRGGPSNGPPRGTGFQGAPPPPPPPPPFERPPGIAGERGGGPGFNNAGAPFLAVASTAPKYWVGVRMPFISIPGQEQSLRSVLMFISPGFFTNPFFFDLRPWLAMGGVALLITAICWLPLMRNVTHSIAAMKKATARIAEGHFDVESRETRRDELGLLDRSINQMADRLQTLTEGRKRFLGDAAHELRSPIARMQLAAEILERHSAPGTEKYVASLKEDLSMMTQLTDELLAFARAEGTFQPAQLTPVNVADAASMAIRRESTAGADVRLKVDSTIAVLAIPDYFVRALSNILRNAIRYAGDRGPIEITASRKNQDVEVRVVDSGPGIPEEELDKVFTPFYRLDDARDRRTGGAGLGLAIVRTCIGACGGVVECRNRRPSGLQVVIRLKAAS